VSKTIRTIVIITIGLLVAAGLVYQRLRPAQHTPVAAQGGGSGMQAKLPVDVVVATPRVVRNTIKVTGSIMANEEVALQSEISGRVEQILFKEGQRVQKGKVLLTINDEEISAQAERLRYMQKLNEEMEFRQRQLLEKEAISREEYDIALTTLNTTLAEIKEKEAILAKHRIRAPFDGIVGLREVSEGSYITPGNLVCHIYNVNPIKIEFSVPGKYLNEIQTGDSVFFTTEASNRTYSGLIYAFEPRIDPTTRTLKIRAISPNRSGDLLPGQFVNITYVLDVIPDALMVPSEAVIPEMNGHQLYVYSGGQATQTQVVIGLRTEQEVQIVQGIAPGDTVITTGILQMRPGLSLELNSVE
jgi:membrane fusion protein (multidrug efflux system)